MTTVQMMVGGHNKKSGLAMVIVVLATALLSVAEEGRAAESWGVLIETPSFFFSTVGHMAAACVSYMTGHAMGKRRNGLSETR